MAVSRTRMIVVAAMIVLLAAVGATAGDDVMFAYSFNAGTSNDYKVSFNQEIDMSGMAFSTIGDFEITEKCIAVTDTAASMEIVFTKVEASAMMFGQMQDDPTGGKLVNQAIAFKVTPEGKVTDIAPAGYLEGWEQLQQVVKPVIESAYIHMPNKSVAMGTGWTHNDDSGEEGMVVKSAYDFVFNEMKKENDRNCAQVEGTLKSTFAGSLPMPMGEMEADGNGKGKVKALFDPKAQMIVTLEVSSENKIDMVPVGGGDTQEMTVNFEMKRTLKKK